MCKYLSNSNTEAKMAQEKDRPIKLAIHESSDPSVIDPNGKEEASYDFNDLNDSSHDAENVDVPIPEPFNDIDDENAGSSPITTANISAG